MLAACMLLDHVGDGERGAASCAPPSRRRSARGRRVTRDLGGTATTDEFTDAVIARL